MISRTRKGGLPMKTAIVTDSGSGLNKRQHVSGRGGYPGRTNI